MLRYQLLNTRNSTASFESPHVVGIKVEESLESVIGFGIILFAGPSTICPVMLGLRGFLLGFLNYFYYFYKKV